MRTPSATLAAQGHELSVQAGLASEQAMLLAVQAFVAAYRGDAEACRAAPRRPPSSESDAR